MIKKYDVFQRTEDLGAWTRSTLWGKHIGDFLRSSYYHEFARPLHSLDGVGVSMVMGGMHVGLQLHRDSIRGGGCGVRELALLRLLLPSFEVGLGIAMAYFRVSNGESVSLTANEPPAVSVVSPAGMRHWHSLTKRELEVAGLLAARRSNYEIAELLHVSRATAKRHTENILLKLGLHSRREVERVIDSA
ncbi:MAG: response regulator transcription factor [Gemmatimonadaceae bacterium]